MPFAPIEDAIAAIQRGEIVIAVDDEDRENEGDLIIAAENMTPEKMAFMIRYTSGVICMPMEGDRLDDLNIPLMVMNNENTEVQRTAFTVSVDFRGGTTTGIMQPTAAPQCTRCSIPRRVPAILRVPVTSSRCATATVACSSVPATPRRRSTSRPRRSLSGGRARGSGERRRHDGAPPAARGVRRRAQPRTDLDRRSVRHRRRAEKLGAACRRGADPHRLRRLHCGRLRVDHRRHRARRVRDG